MMWNVKEMSESRTRKKLLQIDVALKENWFCYYKRYMYTRSLFGSTCVLISQGKKSYPKIMETESG